MCYVPWPLAEELKPKRRQTFPEYARGCFLNPSANSLGGDGSANIGPIRDLPHSNGIFLILGYAAPLLV